jgi:hypothetical protein
VLWLEAQSNQMDRRIRGGGQEAVLVMDSLETMAQVGEPHPCRRDGVPGEPGPSHSESNRCRGAVGPGEAMRMGATEVIKARDASGNIAGISDDQPVSWSLFHLRIVVF